MSHTTIEQPAKVTEDDKFGPDAFPEWIEDRSEHISQTVDRYVRTTEKYISASKGLTIKERIGWFLLGGGFSVLFVSITNYLN